MTQTLRFRTNLNCNSCVAGVRPYLDGEPTISRWDVDIARSEKTLTVEGDSITAEAVKSAVDKAGFKVLGEMPSASPTAGHDLTESEEQSSYFPLFLVTVFLIGVVALVEVRAGSLVWERAMQNFMGAFFLTFAFFKLLNLRGFADSYRMYDVVAKRLPAYGYVYPFIELALGMAYVAGIFPVATNAATLVVMSISSVGVIESLLAKRKIRCACLGAVFNLPMSTLTLVEDVLMIAMAAVMLGMG